MQRDSEITTLLSDWFNLDEENRRIAISPLPTGYEYTLKAYSERMASLAVRNKDSKLISWGLIALGLDGWRGDWREPLMIVALHYDAALRIGVDPVPVFEEAARLVPALPAEGYRTFLVRTPEDRSIEAMAYHAGSDEDGFRYVSDQPMISEEELLKKLLS